MKNQNKAYLFAIISVLMWSTVASVFNIALNNISIDLVLFISSVISALILFVIIKATKKTIDLPHKNELLLSLITGFINPFLYYLILFKAYSILPAQEAMVLNYVWPLALVILSVFFFKQKIDIFGYISIFCGFIGIVIIATKANILNFRFSNLQGDFLAIISSVFWAAYWILNLKDKREAIIKLFWGFVFGSIYSIIYLLLFTNKIEVNNTGLISSIYIGLFEMSITFFFWLSALKYSESSEKVSILIFLSPILSMIWISIILKENIHFSTIIGFAFIAFGISIKTFYNLIIKK